MKKSCVILTWVCLLLFGATGEVGARTLGASIDRLPPNVVARIGSLPASEMQSLAELSRLFEARRQGRMPRAQADSEIATWMKTLSAANRLYAGAIEKEPLLAHVVLQHDVVAEELLGVFRTEPLDDGAPLVRAAVDWLNGLGSSIENMGGGSPLGCVYDFLLCTAGCPHVLPPIDEFFCQQYCYSKFVICLWQTV